MGFWWSAELGVVILGLHCGKLLAGWLYCCCVLRHHGQPNNQSKAKGPSSDIAEFQKEASGSSSHACLIALTLLIFAMLIMWLPWFVHTIRSTLLNIPEPDTFLEIASWMSISLSGLNPFLFNAANDDMRRALRKMCSRKNKVGGVSVAICMVPVSTEKAACDGHFSLLYFCHLQIIYYMQNFVDFRNVGLCEPSYPILSLTRR